jgi:hypothetical protein
LIFSLRPRHPAEHAKEENLMESEYLTVKDLLHRGWTRGLIKRHLGPEDCRFPVDHWANWTGKYAWHVARVERAETTEEFEASFRRSARIRRLPAAGIDRMIERIRAARERAPFLAQPIAHDEESVRRAILERAADPFARARRFGFRTPHKC